MQSNSIFYRPSNSYFHFPTKKEEMVKDKRIFYYGQIQFTEKQKKALVEYKKFLVHKKENHSAYITDQKIVLYLHQRNFKYQDVFKLIKVHDQWRKANLPLQMTPEIKAMLESGIIYISGRDHRYRPIVVMNLKLFDEKKTDLIIRSFTYFFEEIIEKVFLPGQVQQWIIIMNVEGFSLFSLPLGGGKVLLNHLETHYRGRLYKMYLVNSPSAVWLSWKIVKQFLEDETVQKVNIISDNKIKELYRHTNLSQIEVKFGGTQPNRKIFWPGNRVQEYFSVNNQKFQSLHISKEEYAQMVKKIPLNIIHPDYLQLPEQPLKKQFIKLQQKNVKDQKILPNQKAPKDKITLTEMPEEIKQVDDQRQTQKSKHLQEAIKKEKTQQKIERKQQNHEQSQKVIELKVTQDLKSLNSMNTQMIIANNIKQIQKEIIKDTLTHQSKIEQA